MDGILLESVEGLGHSPFVADAGEIWDRLQAEKEEVSRELLAQGTLCGAYVGLLESEAAEEYALEIRWRHRQQLEGRLQEVNDAQDRLNEGAYGRCTECGEKIEGKRLMADPAASHCLACRRTAEAEYTFSELSGITAIH